MKVFAQLTKVDVAKRLVYGIAAAEQADRSGEILDYASSKPHFEKWVAETMEASGGQSQGNLRAMHGKVAAGKLVGIEYDDANLQFPVVAKVVDDNEWEKVLEGVYTGFSIGGAYANKWDDATLKKADGKAVVRYTAKPNELSLVDRACIPAAKFFDIQKVDGSVEQVLFKLDEKMSDEDQAAYDKMSDEEKKAADAKRAKPAADDKAAPAAEDKKAPPAAEDKKAEADEPAGKSDTPEYQVAGTEDDVASLAKIMEDEKVDLGFVIKAVGSSLALRKHDADVVMIVGAEDTGALRKGMYILSQLANVCASLDSIRQSVVWEQKNEADSTSVLPARMRDMVTMCCEALKDVVAEETAELMACASKDFEAGAADAGSPGYPIMQMMAKGDIFAPLRALKKSDDTEALQKLHADLFPVVIEKVDAEPPIVKVDSPDLAKFVADEIEKLTKAHSTEMENVLAKIAKLEAQPAAPKAILRVISKGGDTNELNAPEAATVVPVLKSDGEVNEIATAIKAQHAKGGLQILG